MDKIYVTGHRNPDTDSIVSAMAYAALRNAVGDREYVAARLGQLSDETKAILERFGFEAPIFVKNMRTQVQDLDFDTPPILNQAVTVDRAWSAMEDDRHVSAIPITNDDGKLVGMLTPGDVAEYNMRNITDPTIQDIPLFNLLSVLEGKLLNEPGHAVNVLSGRVVIALPGGLDEYPFREKETILICGRQPEVIRAALEMGVSCIILCQAELPADLRDKGGDTCIIATPYDPYRTMRMVFQAIPAGCVCRRDDIQYFHLDDYIDDVQNTVLESRFRAYPILDEEERVVGTLSRYHLLRPRRKQVILMDHNEKAQSVPGLDQAEILEIIDHHRLADIQTKNPITVRNEPVGSTTTIVAGMYQDKGLMPTAKMAGLMAAAIVSDTVMFKSPTCTQRDIDVANRMARIASISLKELGQVIFSASGGGSRSVEEIFRTDYKEFHIAGHNLAVSQVTCMDSDRLLQRKEEFLDLMTDLQKKQSFDMVILMITDVLLEGTQLLFVGDKDSIRQAFNVEDVEDVVFLPKVMSRKKQVIPMLSALWG